MKTITYWFVAMAVMGALTIRAADDKEKDLPPGLQKKDKLPPGIAKKRGKGESAESDSKSAATPAAPATPATPATPAAPPPSAQKPSAPAAPARSAREVKAEFNKRMQAVNTLDNQPAAASVALAAIAKETGVPLKTIEVQHKEHPTVGTAGLLMANELARATKKPARTFLAERAKGKDWDKIAEENKFNLDAANAKLEHVEHAMAVTTKNTK